MKQKLSIVLLTIAHFAFAQLGGEQTYQFLNLANNPRQAALGGKLFATFDDDVFVPLWNPAVINKAMDKQLAVSYVDYLGDISYGSAAYAYTVDRRVQTYHFGVTFVDYGKFVGADEQGNLTGSFTGKEVAFSVGYAKNIAWTDLYFGGNVKFISSQLESYTSLGAAVDLGLTYKNEDLDFNASLVVRNLGVQLKAYDTQKEQLPLDISFGMSQQLEHVPIRWYYTLENLQKWNIIFSNPARAQQTLGGETIPEKQGFIKNIANHSIVGIELFPQKGFNIRMSYNFRRSNELKILEQRAFSGFSLGFGMRFNKVHVNYAYSKFNNVSNASFFSVTIDLNR